MATKQGHVNSPGHVNRGRLDLDTDHYTILDAYTVARHGRR